MPIVPKARWQRVAQYPRPVLIPPGCGRGRDSTPSHACTAAPPLCQGATSFPTNTQVRLTAPQLQLRSPPSVGHYCSMKRPAHNSKTLHGSSRAAPVRPTPDPTPSPLSPSHHLRSSIPPAAPSRAPSSASVRTPANFNTSPWTYSICIRPASAAPAASF
jgi:hypothetical protein